MKVVSKDRLPSAKTTRETPNPSDISTLSKPGSSETSSKMPQDLICRKCNFTMSVGWYHYHDFSSGYGSRTAFACGKCGVTHYVEHAVTEGTLDRYLYHEKRSCLWEKNQASMPPGKPKESSDQFTGFDNFVCPICSDKGNVITAEKLQSGTPKCPVCGEPLEDLGFWVT